MVAAINDLYCGELRLWLNLYLPSVKLVKKVRVGAKVRRVYDAPQTPWQRVLASGPTDAARMTELKRLLSLDPFLLGEQIDEKPRLAVVVRRVAFYAEEAGEGVDQVVERGR